MANLQSRTVRRVLEKWGLLSRRGPLVLKPSAFRQAMNRQISEITWFLFVTSSVLLFGTVGYSHIEGWPLFDSLYMTVITLAAVGFQEVHPLSNKGRLFTILLITLGVGLVTVVFSTIAQKIVQRQIFGALRGKRMQDLIRKLEGHTIFCGYGRLTRIAAAELREAGVKLVIIEREALRAQEARDAGFLVVEGDATVDETLLQAGVRKANRLVSLLPKDSDNLYVILTCRESGPDLFILSRAEDEVGEKRLRRAGANRLISPYRVGGQKIAEGLMRPYVTDFLDLAVSSSQGHLQIEEIRIPAESPMVGFSLQEAALRQKTNVIVAAIISPSGRMIFNPDASTKIEGGSTFIAMGLKQELLKLEALLLGEAATTP
jgi:voltage-gated potassium channel